MKNRLAWSVSCLVAIVARTAGAQVPVGPEFLVAPPSCSGAWRATTRSSGGPVSTTTASTTLASSRFRTAHFVELDWKRSSGPDANDGSFELWIDGASVHAASALDNSVSAVDFVRMGALSVKVGAAGTLYRDEFESRRVNYIGP
jgi:hypothetical protein